MENFSPIFTETMMIEICTVIGVAVISIVVAVVVFHILVIGYVLIEKIREGK